jgi:hypothetical protein
MVTAAHSNDRRNQLTCIEKGKPKNNNKIRQHEKNQTHLSIPPLFFPCPAPFLLKQSPLQLSLPSIAMTASNACGQSSPPLLPPSPATKEQSIINHHHHHRVN